MPSCVETGTLPEVSFELQYWSWVIWEPAAKKEPRDRTGSPNHWEKNNVSYNAITSMNTPYSNFYIGYLFPRRSFSRCFSLKCKRGIGPKYLSDLLVSYDSGHSIRSEASRLLSVPCTKHVTYGDCAFFKAAPTIWNSILAQICNGTSIRSFKH